jgi:hypothetical protein
VGVAQWNPTFAHRTLKDGATGDRAFGTAGILLNERGFLGAAPKGAP